MTASTMGSRRFRMAALAATAILALTGIAGAQPFAGHGDGPGHPGGMEVEQVLGAVKGQLNLNTSQQLAWDNAVAQTNAAHAAGRAAMQKIHDAMATELAKAEPDLAAVAALTDSLHTDGQTLRKGVRNQWLQIYATFSPDQKAVVRDALAKRMARMETMGAKMREHFQQFQQGG